MMLAENGESYPIFNYNQHGPMTLFRAAFIDGGRALAVHMDAATPWMAFDRSGQFTFLPESLNTAAVHGTRDGYVFLTRLAGHTELRRHYFEGGVLLPDETTIWQSEDDEGFWTIAWATPLTGAEELPAFTIIEPE